MSHSPGGKSIPHHHLPGITIPNTLHNILDKITPNTRMSTTHLPNLLSQTTQARRQKSWSSTPDLHPIRLELMIPIQHQDIQCRLTTPIPNGLEINLFRPTRRQPRCREVRFSSLGDMGQTRYEN